MDVPYQTVVSPVLVGREATLALFEALLAGLQAGDDRPRGQTVLVAGEAGIGKSRLMREVRGRAEARGLAVLQAHCFEADRALPYSPLIDLLQSLLADLPAAERLARLGPLAPHLARLLPGLAALLPDVPAAPSLGPEQDRRHLQQAIAQLLSGVAAGRPLVVIVEDLQWSDDSSLEALLWLARRIPAQPIVLLLTYRPDETHPALDHFLAELNRGRLAAEVTLDPLTPAEVDAMVRAIFQLSRPTRPEFLDPIYKLTEGNPFFIEEVLKSLVAAGDIFYADGEWDRKAMSELHIPRSVQDAVQQRVTRLEPDARRLLAVAAVAGRRSDLGLLQHLAALPEDELLRLVRALIDAQLLVEESAEQIAFRHELTRQAISSGLLARERQRLHRAIAGALEQTQTAPPGGLLPALAHHFYEAGDCEKALAYALEVAEQAAAVYAHAEALHYLDRARQCAERLGWADHAAAMHERMGDVYFVGGPVERAVEAYRRALALAPTDAARAVLQSKIGRSYMIAGDQRGLAPLHTALDVLDPETQQRELALALATLGRYYHLNAEHDRAIGFLERAWKLAEPLDDTLALGDIYVFLAGSYQNLLRFEESMAWALAGIALGERKGYPFAMAIGYEYLAENAANLGQWREALEYANSDREIGERMSSHARVGWAEWCRATAYLGLGELDSALQAALAGRREAEQAGDLRLMMWVRGTLILIYTAMGAEEEADAEARLAEALAGELGQLVMGCWSAMAVAGLDRLRGEAARAAARLDECAAQAAGTRNRLAPLFMGPMHAEVYYDLGRLDEAERLAGELLALAAGAESLHRQGIARRIQGQVWAAQGRTAEAAAALDEAVATLDRLDSRPELAHALAARGRLRQAADPEAARADLARALAVAEACGLRPLQVEVRAGLARLHRAARDDVAAERELAAARAVVDDLAAGYRDPALRARFLARARAALPRSRPPSARQAAKQQFGGLTARERQVAALIAQGKSNRDIAEALVISERTVTTHVTNILNKLGFTSRSQVAAWATDRKLK